MSKILLEQRLWTCLKLLNVFSMIYQPQKIHGYRLSMDAITFAYSCLKKIKRRENKRYRESVKDNFVRRAFIMIVNPKKIQAIIVNSQIKLNYNWNLTMNHAKIKCKQLVTLLDIKIESKSNFDQKFGKRQTTN